MNKTLGKKEVVEEFCGLEILERRSICHVQICTKLGVTNGGKNVYSICILNSWFL
jgi:hypothetical protein